MNGRSAQRLRALDHLAAALGILAFVMLTLRYGFPHWPIPRFVLFAWSALLPIGFFLEAMYRLLWVDDPWRYLARHPLRYLLLLMIVLELSNVAAWSSEQTLAGASAARIASELYLAVFLFGFAGSWAKGAILANRWLANRRVPVLTLPAITFAVAIVAGSLLLSLPGLQQRPLSWLDNLFTAASALCVTGLTVYDVATSLNPLGQAMLALLIQIGGLGTLTILGMLALWHGGSLTLGERAAFSELVGGAQQHETKKLLGTVLRVTLLIEAFGALGFWLLWRDRLEHPLLQGVFHAISAFCNAGFALFRDSFTGFREDPATLVMVMLLIIAGGAGFPVIANLAQAGSSRLVPWQENRPLLPASRVVLYWSGGLIALGALLFLTDGWLHGEPRNLLTAVFQSVTARTAGFQIESQLRFGLTGLLGTILLMIIGASPQSTGGGVKTAVLARLFQRLDPRDERQSSQWFITFKPFRLALLLIGLYALTGLGAAFLLLATEARPLADVMFESFSALGTVGLTRDLTPALSAAGKGIVIALMFTGRVLYPTLVIWMIRGRRACADPVPWA